MACRHGTKYFISQVVPCLCISYRSRLLAHSTCDRHRLLVLVFLQSGEVGRMYRCVVGLSLLFPTSMHRLRRSTLGTLVLVLEPHHTFVCEQWNGCRTHLYGGVCLRTHVCVLALLSKFFTSNLNLTPPSRRLRRASSPAASFLRLLWATPNGTQRDKGATEPSTTCSSYGAAAPTRS